MQQPKDELAKVNVRVSRDLHADLLSAVPWGLRRHLVEAVLRLILDAIKADGQIVTGAILAGEFKLTRTIKKPSKAALHEKSDA